MKKTMIIPATIAIIISLISSASAITITPGIIDAKDLDRGASYVYEAYIINNEQTPQALALEITPRSTYLKPYMIITPQTFTIAPGKKEAIRINMTIPSDQNAVSNGTHTLTILPVVTSQKTGGVALVSSSVIELRFNIPGTVIDRLELERFIAPNAKEKEPITFELQAKNTGNIRQRAIPYIDIYHYGNIIDTLRATTQYTIEPGQSSVMRITYPASSLESGKYRSEAYLVSSTGKKSVILEQNFMVTSEEKDTEPSHSSPPEEESSGTPVQYTKNTPIKEEGTINIGSSDTAYPAPDGSMMPGVSKDSEIMIRHMAAIADGKVMHITLVIENTGTEELDYDLKIDIYDRSEKKIGTIISSATIKGKESLDIKKSWEAQLYGNYTIKAELTYIKEDSTKKKISKETTIDLKSQSNTLTGLVLGAGGKSGSALVLVLLISALVLAFRMKKKNTSLMAAASKRYSSVEDNLKKIAEKTAGLKERIMRLKNGDKEAGQTK